MPSVHELAARWLSLDEVCDRFEEACLTGSRPKIEDFLANVPAEHRLETVRELLKVDAYYRRKVADEPSVAEYRERFPELDGAWLRTMLSPPSRGGSPSQSSIAARGWSALDPLKLPSVPGYEVLELIGRGGMGVVYKTRQVSLNRLVALKFVLAGDMAGPETLARFRAEARAVAQLQHPNLVQIYEVGEHEGRPFLSFEFIEGGGLDQRLQGVPQLPKLAAQLIKTLAHAVQFAHTRSIIHRDLKPANILLSQHARPTIAAEPTLTGREVAGSGEIVLAGASGDDKDQTLADSGAATRSSEDITGFGFPKISDFGLAKNLDNDAQQTKSGAILGTPSYMAPEQATGRVDAIGPATDMYALGAILYEIADWPASVPRADGDRDVGSSPLAGAAVVAAYSTERAARSRNDLFEVSAKRSFAAVRLGGCAGRRPRPFPARRASPRSAGQHDRANVAMVPSASARGNAGVDAGTGDERRRRWHRLSMAAVREFARACAGSRAHRSQRTR